jgi:hypothetical protein
VFKIFDGIPAGTVLAAFEGELSSRRFSMSKSRSIIGSLSMLAAGASLLASGLGRPTILPPKPCPNAVATECSPPPPPPLSMKPGPSVGSRPVAPMVSKPAPRIAPARPRY